MEGALEGGWRDIERGGARCFLGKDGGARRHVLGAEVGGGMGVGTKEEEGAATGENFHSGKMV